MWNFFNFTALFLNSVPVWIIIKGSDILAVVLVHLEKVIQFFQGSIGCRCWKSNVNYRKSKKCRGEIQPQTAHGKRNTIYLEHLAIIRLPDSTPAWLQRVSRNRRSWRGWRPETEGACPRPQSLHHHNT